MSGRHALLTMTLLTGTAAATPLPFSANLTRASITVPGPDTNSFTEVVRDTFDESYEWTVTGGTGTGYIWFNATVIGHDWRAATHSEYVGLHAFIYSPIFVQPVTLPWLDHAPYQCSGRTCGVLEFQYGVPQTVRVASESEAKYYYQRNPNNDIDPTQAGQTFTAYAAFTLNGIYEVDPNGGYRLNTNAVLNSVSLDDVTATAETPEPGTLALVGIALMLAVGRRR